MKKTLFGLLAVVTVAGLSALPAKADAVYINGDGTMSTLGSCGDVVAPDMTSQIITQPAVLDTSAVLDTTPVVTSPTIVAPTVIDDPVLFERRNHLLDVGIPGLFGVHLF